MSSQKPSRRRGRPSHRNENHGLAQKEAEQALTQAIPDHPLIPTQKPEMVETDAAFAEVVAHVRDHGSFAYDTEFIGEETYFAQLCLVQIATPSRLVLVDPLAGVDLMPLWELIADPAIETLVHAGQQDLEPVVRHLNKPPRNIFDSQLAAGFLALPYPLGLRAMVEAFVGLRLGKGLTFTRWDKRPLSDVHQRYAADDVRYLMAIRERIGEQLDACGHTAWARAECESLEDVARYRFDQVNQFRKLIGNRRLKRKPRARLWALAAWRDRVAREENVPPRMLMRDDVVIRLLDTRAKTPEALAEIRGFPRPLAASHGADLLETLADPPDAPSESAPHGTPSDETPIARMRVESLVAMASGICISRGIAPSLVFNRKKIAQFHARLERGDEHPAEIFPPGWRRDIVGAALEAFTRESGELAFCWGEKGVEPPPQSDD